MPDDGSVPRDTSENNKVSKKNALVGDLGGRTPHPGDICGLDRVVS